MRGRRCKHRYLRHDAHNREVFVARLRAMRPRVSVLALGGNSAV